MDSIVLAKNQLLDFETNGFLKVEKLLNANEILFYKKFYEAFLTNKIDTTGYRSDLGKNDDKNVKVVENITQIMVPSRLKPDLLEKALHLKSLSLAKQLLGNDMALDFDMLIDKAPFTNTPTPWHQDRAYWITMPDTRAASCWVALDDAMIDNGCMWYIPGSHLLPIRSHWSKGNNGGALECLAEEKEGKAIEVKAGDCIFHHGGTVHYSRGNSTNLRRRAFITNYRPAAMIAFERENGYDHTGKRMVKDDFSK